IERKVVDDMECVVGAPLRQLRTISERIKAGHADRREAKITRLSRQPGDAELTDVVRRILRRPRLTQTVGTQAQFIHCAGRDDVRVTHRNSLRALTVEPAKGRQVSAECADQRIKNVGLFVLVDAVTDEYARLGGDALVYADGELIVILRARKRGDVVAHRVGRIVRRGEKTRDGLPDRADARLRNEITVERLARLRVEYANGRRPGEQG